jgi:NAD(P)-dependent dehydrogenase (short-subunit alcohol dehydrogenase family)
MSESRLAVIVGASSGIGRETALEMAEAGWDLILASRNETALKKLAMECEKHGVTARAFKCDVRSYEDCEKLAFAAKAAAGGARPALIYSSGVASLGPFLDQTSQILKDQVETNLLGALYLLRALTPWLLEKGAEVVLVGSIAATRSFPGAEAYCATKAGLAMLGRCYSKEFRDRGLRVTVINPGSVDTPLWDKQQSKPDPEDMLSPKAVAETIRAVLTSPPDRSFDEILLMPPKGIL